MLTQITNQLKEIFSIKKPTTIFQIKRSETSDIPSKLKYGELAFSFKSKTLFIGDENENPIVIIKSQD